MNDVENFLEGLTAGESIEFANTGRRSGYFFTRNGHQWPIATAQGADSFSSLGIPLRHIIHSWNMGLCATGLRVVVITAFRENGRVIENLQEEWFDKNDNDPSLPRWGQHGGGWPRGVARIIFTVTSINS